MNINRLFYNVIVLGKAKRASLVLILMLLVCIQTNAGGTYYLTTGETKSLYLTTSKTINSATWYSTSISNVEVTSYGSTFAKIKAVKSYSLPVIVRCDYYYWITSGTYSYLASGFDDFTIYVNPINPTGISITSDLTLGIGYYETLTPILTPTNAETTLSWTTSNSNVATVTSNGQIHAINPGTAIITVSTSNNFNSTCEVTVPERVNPTNISIPSNLTLTLGDDKTLYPILTPTNAETTYTWTTTNSAVATVSNTGLVRTVNPGNATITVKTSNNLIAMCEISVREPSFTVNNVNPSNNSQGVFIKTEISANFSLPIFKGSKFTDISFMNVNTGNQVDGDLTITGEKMTFIPKQELDYNTNYKLIIPIGAISNQWGTVFPSIVEINFRTGLLTANCLVNFTGLGASTIVDSVIVQNITKKTQMVVPYNYTLNLIEVANLVEKPKSTSGTMKVLSNGQNKPILTFNSEVEGDYYIRVFNMSGMQIASLKQHLGMGENAFELTFPKGIYIINVLGNGKNYSARFINTIDCGGIAKIAFSGQFSERNNMLNEVETVNYNSVGNAVKMRYSIGDQIIFYGRSGKNCTLVSFVATKDTTINFNFVECKDADGNYYAVTQIGTQTWMTENLKTTRYKDGTAITNTLGDYAWEHLTTGAYCYYNNNKASSYGCLYNWYAVNTGKLAPIGWHVPSKSEWEILSNYMIANGYNCDTASVGDFIAKSLAASYGWNSSTKDGAIGNDLTKNNRSCFSALPGGHRNEGGSLEMGTSGDWWSSTKNREYAWGVWLNCNSISLGQGNFSMYVGSSVRCVKDN